MAFIKETTPSIATATSVTVLSANASRKFLLIQNNSAANIMVSLSGATLTGIVPTSTNIGFVLIPTASYSHEFGTDSCPQGAVTVYQTSGGTIRTVVVGEG
jgi:hypothetical protein